MLKFWLLGAEVEVSVDDRILADQAQNFVFSRLHPPNPDLFWFQIVEKAWAKFTGSYSDTEFG